MKHKLRNVENYKFNIVAVVAFVKEMAILDFECGICKDPLTFQVDILKFK